MADMQSCNQPNHQLTIGRRDSRRHHAAARRSAAQADPVRFVADLPQRAILDEVQRVPTLFTALKVAVDRDRQAGRFILTGSANVLLVPRLADSLAGRMEIIRLFPFAQCEIEGRLPTLHEGSAVPSRVF